MASKGEEELQKLSMEMRLLEQTAEALQSRMSMVNAASNDLLYAQAALEGLGKEADKSEILVPIGGTSYIRARLENPDKVIVGMGAGVSVEKTREEAKEIVKKRLEDIDKTRKSVQQQYSQIAERIDIDRERAEGLIAAARQRKPTENV
ncbi:MAG TPA: prefoldin subunit alpha [Candidatus Bathyarchaeia archaeon]|nr:prefoldin subunit alpha [Candidatus Bathyarchaeia archaeon]